jgi:hypothetical protein
MIDARKCGNKIAEIKIKGKKVMLPARDIP